jgi:hypothetical protein
MAIFESVCQTFNYFTAEPQKTQSLRRETKLGETSAHFAALR